MEIVFVIGILAAFMLGAYVRRPFSFVQKKQETKPDSELSEEQKKAVRRARIQLENLLNAGNPGYKQQQLED